MNKNCSEGLVQGRTEYQTVADPGFPKGGGANPKEGRQPILWPIFPENCMKMKKFWATGRVVRPSRPPPP